MDLAARRGAHAALWAGLGGFIGVFLWASRASVGGIKPATRTCIARLAAERGALSSGCLN